MKNLKLHTEILKHKLKYMFIISKIIYINPSDNIIEKVILNQIHSNENIIQNNNKNHYSENSAVENSISQNESILNGNQNIQNHNINEKQINEIIDHIPTKNNYNNKQLYPFLNINNINKKFGNNINLYNNKCNDFKNSNYFNNNVINYNKDYCDEYNEGVDYEQEEGVDYEQEEGVDYEQEEGVDYEQEEGVDYEQEEGVDYEQEEGVDYEQEEGVDYEQEKGVDYEHEEDYNEECNKNIYTKYNYKDYIKFKINEIEKKGESTYEKQKNLNAQEEKRLEELNKELKKERKPRSTKEEIKNSKRNEDENKKQKNNIEKRTWKSIEKNFKPEDKIHTKYKVDNIIRKINSSVINKVLIKFINEKIKNDPKLIKDEIIYKNQNKIFTLCKSNKKIEIKEREFGTDYKTKKIGHKLNMINAQFIENSNSKYNIGLLNLTIRDILSLPITNKCPYDKFANKIIIDNLISSLPEKYKELFNITYLNVIKYYANTSKDEKINNLLKDMKQFEEKPNDEYTKKIKNIISYYDIFFYSRYNRPSKEKKNKISQLDINDEINISNLDDEKLYFTAIDYKISTEKNNENNNTLINKKRKNSSSSQND